MKQQNISNSLKSEVPVGGSMLEQILDDEMKRYIRVTSSADSTNRISSPIVGRCIDPTHPVLWGRIRVQWEIFGNTCEKWLPTIHGMTFRENDQVLVQFPGNREEPVVVGVIDGYAKRPEAERPDGPVLALRDDESIKVLSETGARLLEIFRSQEGPVFRILNNNVNLDFPGKLRVSAKDIEMLASEGSVSISATDDVEVQGEEIRLN